MADNPIHKTTDCAECGELQPGDGIGANADVCGEGVAA